MEQLNEGEEKKLKEMEGFGYGEDEVARGGKWCSGFWVKKKTKERGRNEGGICRARAGSSEAGSRERRMGK